MNRICGIVAGAMSLMACGCISYTGVVGPGDDLVDEGNMVFAKRAAENYQARKNFKRPVVIQEAEGISLFLSPTYVPRSQNARANALCQNIETRRIVVQSAKARLREVVSALRDFQLTGDAQQQMVTITADDQNAGSQVYRITYNIVNVDLQLREAKAFGFMRKVEGEDNRICYEWVANVSVEVRMIDPNGNAVFNFPAIGTLTQSDDGSLNPNVSMLEQAAAEGITKAMKQYAHKFGPPIYVTDTCQNGEFVRINVGREYGLLPGMKIEFYRQRERAGLDGGKALSEVRVGTGVVGVADAPVEAQSAWVHVDDYKAENRTVFQWTSAKLMQGEGSTSSLRIPGM